MRITAFILLTACLQVSARGDAQTVSITVSNASLEKVFSEIEKQTGYTFFYKASILNDVPKVSVSVKNATIEEVLNICFKDQPLAYTIIEKTILVKKKESTIPNENVTNEIVNGPPPPVDISGRVTNNAGEPLSGANVVIKRTGKGTITNANGEFKLNGVNSDDILVVSYIGYQTLNIKIGEKTSFVLLMNTATDKLDEIKIQAYGTTTDRLRTGNITQVTAEEIERQPVMNVLQALQGKVPGLEIVQQNGFSSSPFKVEIRGRKYLNKQLSPDPLIIVDGVPLNVLNFNGANYNQGASFSQTQVPNPMGGQSPLFSIDPDEIESVTVLKDADATAIYGSRGGSGVILITTKKGKSGATQFNASYSTGFQKNLLWYDLMNTQQYLQMRREALKNSNITNPNIFIAPDLLLWDTTRYTDWQRYIYGGTGRVTNAEMNVGGGDRYTKYRIALNYDTRKNITTTSGGSDRISVSNNISHSTANHLFKIDLTSFYTYNKASAYDFPIQAVLLPPNAPAVFDSLGKLNWAEWGGSGNGLAAFGAFLSHFESKTSYLNSNLSVSLFPVKGFELKSSIGYISFDEESKFTSPISAQNPQYSPVGSLSEGSTKGGTWIVEPQANYKLSIQKLKMELLAGSTLQSTNQKGLFAAGYGYQDDNLLVSVNNAPTKSGGDGSGQYKYAAIFGRVNLNLADKYILNLNARRDGSSRFGKGKQYGNFGSIGGAWIISDEKWFKPLSKIISFAKVRSSYGIVGSDNIGDYAYLTRWTGNQNLVNPYGGNLSYTPTQHANPDLQWQVNKKLEIAGNLNFLNDRISTDISWYRDRVSNQLLFGPLPTLTGFSIVASNMPAIVQNSGWELRLSGEIIKQGNIRLSGNFNIGINRNKLYSFPNIENTAYASTYIVGKSVNTLYLLKYTGVDPATGQYTFEDRDKDGSISSLGPVASNPDAYPLDPATKGFGGFGVDFGIKQFALNVFFTYNNIPLVTKAVSNAAYIPGSFGFSNQSVRAVNRWIKPGDNAEFAKYAIRPSQSDNMYFGSTGNYSKGSFIKLQNVNLSYSFSKNLLKNIKCQTASLFVRAENIFIITKYDGLDPTAPGLGGYPYPFVLSLGANLSF